MLGVSDALRQALAPTGDLRVAINYGNPILARRSADATAPQGVSVDIARALAWALALPLDCVTVDSAGYAVQAVEEDRADIGFFAIDPRRAQAIAFTPPYLTIEGCYLVRDDSPLRNVADIDTAANRITVGLGSAYDLFLTRAIQHAQLERAPTSPTVVDVFIDKGFEVAAGVRQQLAADCTRYPGLRLIDPPFMQIHQAMGLHQARGTLAHQWLQGFIEQLKSDGFIHDALQRHGINGVTVA